jgi:hypothetical protein
MKKIFVLSLVLLVFSCKKGSQDLPISSNEALRSTLTYSIFGEEHNRLLDYVSNSLEFESMNQEEIFDYCQGFQSDYLTGSSMDYASFVDNLDYTKGLVSDISISGSTMLTDGIIKSLSLAIYINELGEIFTIALDTTNGEIITSEEFDNMINTLIEEIESNEEVNLDWESLVGNEFAAMIAMCEIAKHSYSYWYNVANNPTHPWYYRLSSQQFKTSGCIKDAWNAVKRASVDTWTFMSSGECGYWEDKFGVWVYRYDFGCASSAAGNASAGV